MSLGHESVGLPSNPIQVLLSRMIREAEAKARIYYRLCDVNLQPLLVYSYLVTQHSGESEDRANAENALRRFEENYNTIRLSEFDYIREYSPFIVVGMLIPKLKAKLNDVFNTQTQDSCVTLEEVVTTIKVIGNICLDEVRQLATRIRRFDGMEEYKVQIQVPGTDHADTIV